MPTDWLNEILFILCTEIVSAELEHIQSFKKICEGG